jgi:hypothetical protein
LGGERTKTNLQDMRGRGMSGEGGEGVGGMVREPESVEESLARNFWEESSGRAGNWEGRMRGVPKTASAGEWLESSWGGRSESQKEKGKVGNPMRGIVACREGGFEVAVGSFNHALGLGMESSRVDVGNLEEGGEGRPKGVSELGTSV